MKPTIAVPKKETPLKVAFEGFDNIEKNRLSKMLLNAFEMETINMTTKINQTKNQFIIVSKNGQSKDVNSENVKGVVNS